MAHSLVFPIAVTVPNWKALTQVPLERNLILPLDRASIKPEGLAAFISVLGEFQVEGQNPIQTQRNAGNLLRHVMISFLVKSDTYAIYDISMNGPIAILDCEQDGLVIMSGSLQEWRTLVLNLCNSRTSSSGRDLGTEILKALDGLGLTHVFECYSRRVDQTGYVLLSEKKQ
jgi:hypothetical protein